MRAAWRMALSIAAQMTQGYGLIPSVDWHWLIAGCRFWSYQVLAISLWFHPVADMFWYSMEKFIIISS